LFVKSLAAASKPRHVREHVWFKLTELANYLMFRTTDGIRTHNLSPSQDTMQEIDRKDYGKPRKLRQLMSRTGFEPTTFAQSRYYAGN